MRSALADVILSQRDEGPDEAADIVNFLIPARPIRVMSTRI